MISKFERVIFGLFFWGILLSLVILIIKIVKFVSFGLNVVERLLLLFLIKSNFKLGKWLCIFFMVFKFIEVFFLIVVCG